MLVPSSPPVGGGWSFELKWDGFRAVVSTEEGLRVRSRRGWNMTPVLQGSALPRVPESARLGSDTPANRGFLIQVVTPSATT
jgi:ATP-dependent DNA ligase